MQSGSIITGRSEALFELTPATPATRLPRRSPADHTWWGISWLRSDVRLFPQALTNSRDRLASSMDHLLAAMIALWQYQPKHVIGLSVCVFFLPLVFFPLWHLWSCSTGSIGGLCGISRHDPFKMASPVTSLNLSGSNTATTLNNTSNGYHNNNSSATSSSTSNIYKIGGKSKHKTVLYSLPMSFAYAIS